VSPAQALSVKTSISGQGQCRLHNWLLFGQCHLHKHSVDKGSETCLRNTASQNFDHSFLGRKRDALQDILLKLSECRCHDW